MRIIYCSIKWLLLCSTLLITLSLRGQNLDSLEQVVAKEHLTPKEMMKIYDDLSWGYVSIDPDKAISYAKIGLTLSKQLSEKCMESTFLKNIGVAYYMISVNDTALIYLNKGLSIAQSIKDETLMTGIYGAIGNVYNVEGDYEKSLDYYLKSLELAEKNNNKKRMRILNGNIGSLYMGLKNYDHAKEYYYRSMKISNEIGDISGLGQAYDGLSHIYNKKNIADSALFYERKSVEAFKQTGEKHFEAIALQGLSMIYYNLFYDFAQAEKYAKEALLLTKELDLPSYLAGSYSMLSNVYFKQGRFAESEKAALSGIAADTTDTNIYTNMIANIACSNIRLGNQDRALSYFDRYTSLINQRGNESYQQNLSEMETKYETEKKEMKISALEREKRMNRMITIFGLSTLILFIVFLFARQKSIKNKKLLAEQKVLQLEQEKQLVATKAVLDGESAERERLARDLHDGLGGMLSAVKLNLFDMKNGVSLAGEDVLRLNRVAELLDSSINELRRIAHNMMPASLARYGLKIALNDFCNSVEPVQLHYFGNETRLDPQLEGNIYRIIHELVNNALKYAEASVINVQIIQEEKRISITVQDDGKGFDTSIINKGSGLENIKNRINSFNGELHIFSEIGKGTEITIDFNLSNHDNSTNS